MKTASAATQAILAAGQYVLAELYVITPKNGSPLYFTDFDVSLKAAIYPSTQQNTYFTGLTISRGDIVQKTGIDGATLDLDISPQADSGGAAPGSGTADSALTADVALTADIGAAGAIGTPPLISGYPFLQACRLGILDGAILQMAKLFMNPPAAGAVFDTSPGAVSWFLGVVGEAQAGRLKATLKASSPLALMTVQMPRSIFQVGCAHTVYDSGCDPNGTVRKLQTYAGTVGAVINSASNFNTSLGANPDGFYTKAPGVITFTSGVNAGISASVKQFLSSGGNIQLFSPLPHAPAINDQFRIFPGCDHMLATCSNTNPALGPAFNNRIHFKGVPFVPTPETQLDGGTFNPPQQPQGGQSGLIVGSPLTSQQIQS